VAEHGLESGHRIEFYETEVVAETSGYMNRLVEEAMDIKLHRDNINTEEGFKLGEAWTASNSLLRQCNTHTSRKSKENAKR
jgi:hypothetical protein